MKPLIRRTDFYEVWNKFVSDNRGLECIPDHIRGSWERCRKARVDPRKGASLMRLEQDALRARSAAQAELFESLQVHYKNIEQYFSFLPLCLFFADPNGTIRFIEGDDQIIHNMEESSQTTLLGSSIKESVLGTTAPGICLEENRFAAVQAEEHYLQAIHWAACIASPITDGANHLLGVLDFTVAAENTEKLKQLVPLLLNTVNSIQFEIALKTRLDQLDLFHSYYHSTFDYSNSILILADAAGAVIDLNQKAQEFLKISAQGLKHRDIRKILGNQKKVDRLFRGAGSKISLAQGETGPCSAESLPLFDRSGREVAYLLKFEKEQQVKPIPAGSPTTTRYTLGHVIGSSPQIVAVVDRARKAAQTGSTILIEGETGTGKELLAQGIHNESPYRHGPFIPLNCAAIPRELIESELFGYEKGAFTGARQEGNTGKFELANGGTIFLDEIHLMDHPAQAKLLRVIEERRLTRIGGKYALPLNIRIIVATSVDLKNETEKGLFMPALFFRINVVRLAVPNLRERKEDLPLLIGAFIDELNRKFNRSITGLEPSALKMISRFSWPGNVRELKNCLESAYNFCTGETIGPTDLADHIPLETKIETASGQTMEDITRDLLITALQRFGTIKKAADSLGIPLSTFYRKLKKMGVRPTSNGGVLR
ncbi:MAG: sigma 54-interacting transcriptional regulator [Deltaproteobacteria bacterium]|nr:sigma 54-interacting transcriptional regulator [Deltaproteobacteria bacterium]